MEEPCSCLEMGPEVLSQTRVSAFLIDETKLQIGSEEAWLWVAIEPIHKQILGCTSRKSTNSASTIDMIYAYTSLAIYLPEIIIRVRETETLNPGTIYLRR
jgi:hypothetical protein